MYNGEELVAKMRLWLVINGYSMEEYIKPTRCHQFDPCNTCPHNQADNTCAKEKKAWVQEGTLETRMTTHEKVLALNTIGGEVWACIEWIRTK